MRSRQKAGIRDLVTVYIHKKSPEIRNKTKVYIYRFQKYMIALNLWCLVISHNYIVWISLECMTQMNYKIIQNFYILYRRQLYTRVYPIFMWDSFRLHPQTIHAPCVSFRPHPQSRDVPFMCVWFCPYPHLKNVPSIGACVFALTHSERDALCVYFCVGLSFRPSLTLKIENVIWFSDNDLISRSSFLFLEIRFDFWKLIWCPGN